MLRNRAFFAAFFLCLVAKPAFAQEPIRLARTPDISPDGKLVAFSYLGDVYTVETIGGVARPITSHPAHDVNPIFSPDGKHLAFSSNRHGSYDVFVVSVRGGRPTRLTFDSSNEIVTGWAPDGKNVLFASSAGLDFPRGAALYTVPVAGGRVRKVTVGEGKEGSYSPRGDLLAYVRGPGEWYRKGYRGSSNDDIWVCNADGTNNRRLTTFEGQDSSPMWSADGSSLYYVSEFHGVGNIVCQPISTLLNGSARPMVAAKPRQLTQHKEDGVRQARISRDGKWIVYECGADLWVVGTAPGSNPRKLAIEVHADDKANPERVVTFTNDATEFAMSADEKFVAFAVHGKLFRMPISTHPKVTQMTFGPINEPGKAWANDHGMAWAPDGSKMIFVSDRNGHEDLYLLEANDPDHPRFTEAHRFKVTQLTNTREAELGVSFSPDGKRVAFVRAGKLWTMAPNGKDQKIVVNDVQVFDYEWSPDSRWIAYARRDGSFANELYIVPASGATAANPIRNITRYATYNAGITWSANGKKLAFLSDRRGRGGNLFVLDLEKPAAPGAAAERASFLSTWGVRSKAALRIDWEDIHRRARPLGTIIADEAAISPDGTKVAFRDAAGGDLWVASTSGGQVTRLTTGRLFPRQITWSKRRALGSSLDFLYFLDRNGNVRLGRAGGGEAKAGAPDNNTAAIPFKIKMTIKREELYREMFDQSWRHLSENFYDEKFHGRNWDEVRAKYRPLIKHVSMKEDLFAVLHLMLGELNASHLGVAGFFRGPEEATADLGLVFDESYRGKGLKIAEVLKRGPADRRGLNLKAGDVVLSIDGTEIDDGVNLSKLLNGKAGDGVVLQVTSAPADAKAKKHRVEVVAASRGVIADLMYDRWVAKNAARVSELSKGKLGYIHIPSMDAAGLESFVRSLYSDNYDKEAIVLDVRFNGGGNTHDQVLNYLGSKEHTVFKTRGGGEGGVLRSWDRKWHKPLVLLINNRSYSDAEILPNAFRTLGLGKLVGQPTGGLVIGTAGVRLIDGSTFRIPRIGVYTTRGVNMEKEGVKPDVLIENHPDQVARGLDGQLDRAVEVLTADVIVWKKKRGPEVATRPTLPPPPTRGPAPMPPAPPRGGP